MCCARWNPAFFSRIALRRAVVDVFMQIKPIRIERFNQFDLPGAPPNFQSCLPENGGFHSVVVLIPNESLHAVLEGEASHTTGLVFSDTVKEPGRHTYLDRAPVAAGHDVNGRLFFCVGQSGVPSRAAHACCLDGMTEIGKSAIAKTRIVVSARTDTYFPATTFAKVAMTLSISSSVWAAETEQRSRQRRFGVPGGSAMLT